jgi:peptidyl-prolyl cis-trans isomerase D
MLQKMRQNTKAILWVVVVAFVVTIFAVWGLDLQTGSRATDPNIVGKVNGIPISRAQYQFAYQQFAQQLRSTSPTQSLTYAQEEFIRTQAWDSIVYGIITEQQIRELGITVTDQELVDFLRTTPPPEIQQYFVDQDGRFDNQAYQAALNNPEVDWTSLEQLGRERVRRIKLNEYVAAQVHVSEDEMRHAYQKDAVDLSLAYVEFPITSADVGDYAPSDEEIAQYYESHKDNFIQTGQCRVKVVKIPLVASAADLDDAVYTAGRVREQIAAGEEFGALAKTYSEAPTSFVDGNTGFITRAQRDTAYFAALDDMEAGELSDVLTTESGVYVLKLIEKRVGENDETEYNVQEILISSMLSRQTTDSLYGVASEVRDRAREAGLETAANEKQLEIESPPPFPERGSIGTLGMVTSLNDFAFSNEPSAVSDLLRDENNIYIGEVVERIAEHIKPLEEVREVVVQYVLLDRRRTIADRDAKAFYQKARTTDFQTAVETYDLTEKQTGTFRAGDNLEPFGSNSIVAEVGLAIVPGETSPPVEWRLTYFVVNLLSRAEIDVADYKAQIPSVKQRLLAQKAQAFSQTWYQNLVEEADIEDYRLQG